MEKEKNKQAPINARKYWIRLSILFLILLIPFRITNFFTGFYHQINPQASLVVDPYSEGNITRYIYLLISLCIVVFGLKFISKYKLKRHILLTLLISVCLCTSLYQSTRGIHWHCSRPGKVYAIGNASEWDGIIFEPIWCTVHIGGGGGWIEYVKIKYIPITIRSDWFQSLSPNADYLWGA